MFIIPNSKCSSSDGEVVWTSLFIRQIPAARNIMTKAAANC